MPLWVPNANAAQRAREKQGLTQEEVAHRAGIAPGTALRIEQGQPVQAKSLELFAKAVSTTLTSLGRPAADDGTSAPEIIATPSPPPSAAPATDVPLRAESLARPSRLRAMAAREALRPPRRPWKGEPDAPVLTVDALRAIFSSYAVMVGERYAVWGHVREHRGTGRVEAQALGGRAGVVTRFLVVRAIDDDANIGFTVHATTAPHTRALLAASDREVQMVVRVVATDDDQPLFAAFTPETKHPWTLVVEQLIGHAP